jgi:hypothetical protein
MGLIGSGDVGHDEPGASRSFITSKDQEIVDKFSANQRHSEPPPPPKQRQTTSTKTSSSKSSSSSHLSDRCQSQTVSPYPQGRQERFREKERRSQSSIGSSVCSPNDFHSNVQSPDLSSQEEFGEEAQLNPLTEEGDHRDILVDDSVHGTSDEDDEEPKAVMLKTVEYLMESLEEAKKFDVSITRLEFLN